MTNLKVSRRFGRVLTASLSLTLLFACTKGRDDVSAVQGIGDGKKNAVGFIPVHNDANLDLSGIDTENNGSLYARDLIQMPLFALVQCKASDELSADAWLLKLETAAQLNQVKLDQNRQLVTPRGAGGKDDEGSACAVIGTRLLSYPVANRLLEIARTGSAATQDSLAAAQFFYLALKGYDDKNNKAHTSQLLPNYGTLVREHVGVGAPTMDEIAQNLRDMDPLLNPCSNSAPKDPKLKEWRDANFSCEKLDVTGDIYGYVPTKDYTELRNTTATKIDAMHESLNGSEADVAKSSNAALLWDVLTSTKPFDSYAEGAPQRKIVAILKGDLTSFNQVFDGEKYGIAKPAAKLTGGANLTGPSFALAPGRVPNSRQVGGCACPNNPNAARKNFTQQGRTRGAAASDKTSTVFKDFSAFRQKADGATGTRAGAITQRVNDNLAAIEKNVTVQKDATTGATTSRMSNDNARNLYALRAVAKANSDTEQVSKIDKMLSDAKLPVQEWKVGGLGGGSKGQDYVRLEGKNGELAYMDAKTGQQQTWVARQGESFDAQALDAMNKNGTGKTGAEKTAANTAVRFESGSELTGVVNKSGEAMITGGRWRADTTVPGKGVVDTQMGVKFNNGLNDGKGPVVAVHTKTENGYAVPDTSKRQEDHDAVLKAARDTNQAIRDKKLCEQVEGFKAQAKTKTAEADALNTKIGEMQKPNIGTDGQVVERSKEEQAKLDAEIVKLSGDRDKLYADARTTDAKVEPLQKQIAEDNKVIEQNAQLAKEANVGITDKEFADLSRTSCAKLTGGFALDACGTPDTTAAAAGTDTSEKKTAETVADPTSPAAGPATPEGEKPATADSPASSPSADPSAPAGAPASSPGTPTSSDGDAIVATNGGTEAAPGKEIVTPGETNVTQPTKQDFVEAAPGATTGATAGTIDPLPGATTGDGGTTGGVDPTSAGTAVANAATGGIGAVENTNDPFSGSGPTVNDPYFAVSPNQFSNVADGTSPIGAQQDPNALGNSQTDNGGLFGNSGNGIGGQGQIAGNDPLQATTPMGFGDAAAQQGMGNAFPEISQQGPQQSIDQSGFGGQQQGGQDFYGAYGDPYQAPQDPYLTNASTGSSGFGGGGSDFGGGTTGGDFSGGGAVEAAPTPAPVPEPMPQPAAGGEL